MIRPRKGSAIRNQGILLGCGAPADFVLLWTVCHFLSMMSGTVERRLGLFSLSLEQLVPLWWLFSGQESHGLGVRSCWPQDWAHVSKAKRLCGWPGCGGHHRHAKFPEG
jgi:hypothetical protein